MLSLIHLGSVVSASDIVNRLNPTFDRINATDGLSQTSVNVISQDSMGLIWIGTTEGLNRYDGEQFETFFNVPNDDSSISHDYISAIIEDGQGDIWIGTDNGLNVFDRAKSTFSVVGLASEEFAADAAHSSIRSLFIDKEGILWIGTGGGLVRRANDG